MSFDELPPLGGRDSIPLLERELDPDLIQFHAHAHGYAAQSPAKVDLKAKNARKGRLRRQCFQSRTAAHACRVARTPGWIDSAQEYEQSCICLGASIPRMRLETYALLFIGRFRNKSANSAVSSR